MSKVIKQTYQIKASPEEVWEALVNPNYIEEWGGGSAKMDSKVGTEFELWSGDIHGKNIEVLKNRKLVQEWYSGDWQEPSIATFILFGGDRGTRLELIHEKVPKEDIKDIDQGWKDYYLGPIKEYLESK